jgi:hypothetical protein
MTAFALTRSEWAVLPVPCSERLAMFLLPCYLLSACGLRRLWLFRRIRCLLLMQWWNARKNDGFYPVARLCAATDHNSSRKPDKQEHDKQTMGYLLWRYRFSVALLCHMVNSALPLPYCVADSPTALLFST